jgi:Tfp pilus assembly protein PilV
MIMRTTTKNKAARGMTLIEAMMSMIVLLIGAFGLVSAQMIAVRMNHQAQRMAQAASLSNDLIENIQRWSYADPRIASDQTITGSTALQDPDIEPYWEMGTGSTASYEATYSDKASDPNATNDDALTMDGSAFAGIISDMHSVNGIDEPELVRYWNVYQIDFEGSGIPDGKLVQIIVRWRDGGFGFRQITASTFKRNPEKVTGGMGGT